MELKENLNTIINRIVLLKAHLATEEATKHSLVMPFLNALGYDVFDPTVVVPEYIADIGKKKGEKVDYAILKDTVPIILIEVKKHSEELDNHKTQLERYFGTTESKFAILTNGIEYRFFSDLDDVNLMDKKPFLTINLLDLKDRELKELQKFTRDELDIEQITTMASTQKLVKEIKNIFKEEVKNPSNELTKFFASVCTDKRLTQNIIEEYKGYIKIAFSDIVNDMASDKINTLKDKLKIEIEDSEDNENEINKRGIVTTKEETEGFFIVKSILSEKANISDIFEKDTKSYFGILYKNNTRKWICRLYFNTSQKYIGLHSEEKEETKIKINKTEDIYIYKKEILEIADRYIESK